MDIGKFLIGAVFFGLAAWSQLKGEATTLSPNAPPGAIEYFESEDGTGSVTLYEEEIVARSPGVQGGVVSIDIYDITKVRKIGYKFKISGKDGSWIQFDLYNPVYAKKFKESLDDLMYE